MDWLTHIWSKPLASWTLLDVLGMLAVIFIALPIAGKILISIIRAPFDAYDKMRKATAKRQSRDGGPR